MIRLTKNLATAIPLASTPALAAESLSLQSPATLSFTLAAALILTLLFRKSAGYAATRVVKALRRRKIRQALAGMEFVEDALLPGAYGGLARVDFAVRLPGGIACLRVIHVDGTLTGSDDTAQWSVVSGTHRRRMLNPVIQNEGRARAIRKVVGAVPVHAITVACGRHKTLPACVITVAALSAALQAFDASEVEGLDEAWMELKAAVIRDPAAQRDFEAQIGFC